MSTTIEWTDETWNPVTGCTKVSQGCKNCYAEAVANRFWGDRKFTDVQTHDVRLQTPLHWKKPRRVFVNSMSDLFHEDVPFSFIDKVIGVIEQASRHTFQVLTKRPERAAEYFADFLTDGPWPLRNLWLGVSVEDQETADVRINSLLGIPAAVRFVSYEPALGPVDFDLDICGSQKLQWIIVGGESGPGARPFDISWARSTVEQCRAAGVACFVKQLGSNPIVDHPGGPITHIRTDENGFHTESIPRKIPVEMKHRKGEDPSEWPEDLRVRDFPNVARSLFSERSHR